MKDILKILDTRVVIIKFTFKEQLYTETMS